MVFGPALLRQEERRTPWIQAAPKGILRFRKGSFGSQDSSSLPGGLPFEAFAEANQKGSDKSRFRENALPEAVLRYRSKAIAAASDSKAPYQAITHGWPWRVDTLSPEL